MPVRRGVRGAVWVLLTLGALAACGSAQQPGRETSAGLGSGAGEVAGPVELERAVESPEEDVVSALQDPAAAELPTPLVDPVMLVSGGPPPDGIPAIDEPLFHEASSVTWIGADEPVLSLEVNGEARAYPVAVLIWHEIVNDTIAGVPVAVTYCPLCNSAITFERQVGDRVLSFGTSGLLYQSALVMYDRQTESLWSQLELGAVAGVLAGTGLKTIPTQTVAWSDFVAAHPEAWVLSDRTGFNRPYGTNPYVGYDDVGTDPFLFDGSVPPVLPAKERVVGLGGDSDPVAVPLDRLAEERILTEEVDGRDVVLWLQPGLRSPLDTEELSEGRRIGAVAVFEPQWDGQALTFRTGGDGEFVDEQAGSTWNVLGQAVAGPATGARLMPVEHVDTFWFAWSAFRPDTRLAS